MTWQNSRTEFVLLQTNKSIKMFVCACLCDNSNFEDELEMSLPRMLSCNGAWQSHWHFLSSDSLIHKKKHKYYNKKKPSRDVTFTVFHQAHGSCSLCWLLLIRLNIQLLANDQSCVTVITATVFLRMWEAPGLKQNTGFVSTQFWPRHFSKKEKAWLKESCCPEIMIACHI